MVECEWAILCDSVFRDEHKKLCLIGVFTQISTRSVPSAHLHAAVAAKLTGNPDERFQARIEIVRPTGGILSDSAFESVVGANGVVEVVINLSNVPLPDWGIY